MSDSPETALPLIDLLNVDNESRTTSAPSKIPATDERGEHDEPKTTSSPPSKQKAPELDPKDTQSSRLPSSVPKLKPSSEIYTPSMTDDEKYKLQISMNKAETTFIEDPPEIDYEDRIKKITSGGIWSETEGLDSRDWTGEVGNPSANTLAGKTYQPRTPSEMNYDILSSAGLNTEVQHALMSKIELSICRKAGTKFSTLNELLNFRLQQLNEEMNDKLATLTSEVNRRILAHDDAMGKRVAKLEEIVATISIQVEGIKELIPKNGPEEVAVLQEAYNIVKQQQRAADSEGTPSVAERLDEQMEHLNTTAAKLQQMSKLTVTPSVSGPSAPASASAAFVASPAFAKKRGRRGL